MPVAFAAVRKTHQRASYAVFSVRMAVAQGQRRIPGNGITWRAGRARERGVHNGLIAMGKIVELPPIKARPARRHQGLRKLSPDLISKARDETATQVTRIGLTFLGTAAFCMLSLLTPDSALLGGNERINVPFAGPVSFLGFMLLGPTVLILLRVYLQIYVEHSDRLDRLAQLVSLPRAPTLVPLSNPLIRVLSGVTFYLLLPLAMMLFAWKAAVFPTWGSALLCVATGVVVTHILLPFTRFSWRSKGLFSLSAAIIVAVVFVGLRLFDLELPRRPFDLFRANLSGQWLPLEDLREADLSSANLSNANLFGANLNDADLRNANLNDAFLLAAHLIDANLLNAKLSGAVLIDAILVGANLSGADLLNADMRNAILLADPSGANLRNANLGGANLSGADLSGADLYEANLTKADLTKADLTKANLSDANLTKANLSDANLSDSINLTQTQLDKACGNSNTKLPEGFTPPSPCSPDR
jgi:uncharacterized protein YjbI with pentapeptide repeats